jgi:hypothetical protein
MASANQPQPDDAPEAPREITITVFPTQRAALDHAHATGGRAIRVASRNLVVGAEDARWLEETGAVFFYLHELDGQIAIVPVND